MNWLLQVLIYWCWCRWRGHGAFAYETHNMTKPGRPLLSFRSCVGCGKVYPEDMSRVCDLLEADLDEMEAERGQDR